MGKRKSSTEDGTPGTSKKRVCSSNDDIFEKYQFLKKCSKTTDVFCKICNSTFSIATRGQGAIADHVGRAKHKTNLKSVSSTSCALEKFVVPPNDTNQVAAIEATLSYHCIKHHHSFRDNDCAVPLNKTLFSDSKIAQKITCGKTKTKAIVSNVLAPHSVQRCLRQLEKIPFISVSTDASNHGNIKLFPILIQYFDFKSGIQQYLLNIHDRNDETSSTVADMLLKELQDRNLQDKCIGFSADNCNTNFGGIKRRGVNNVYYKMKQNLNESLVGIGCPVHLLHNAALHGTSQLSINIHGIVLALHNYFSISTTRITELKSFADFVDEQHKPLLFHSKTRWLSLLPAVNRIIEMFDTLKAYFNSIEKPPIVIKNFFNDDLTKPYLYLIQSYMTILEPNIKKMEGNDNTVLDVLRIFQNVKNVLAERLENNFVPQKIKRILETLIEEGEVSKVAKFNEEMKNLYLETIEYVNAWSTNFDEFEILNYMWLDEVPTWSSIDKSLIFFAKKNIEIDDGKLFDQHVLLKTVISPKVGHDDWKNLSIVERWKIFFSCAEEQEKFSEWLKITQYLFALFANNASVERIFSLIHAQWSKERNLLEVSSVNSIILTVFNFNMSCEDFHEFISKEPAILKEISNNSKYL